MRIVIDLQGAQTESRFHGIGRYSRDFALTLARNARDHEIWLLLNGAFAEGALDLRHAFADCVPDERVLMFHPATPLESQVAPSRQRRTSAELVREHVLLSVDPDCVLVTSLVETPGTDAVTSSVSPRLDHLSAAIVYDLIPLLRPEQYLTDDSTRRFYEAKVGELGRVKLLLAISESSRREAIDHLQVAPDRVVNISSAAGIAFSPPALDEGARAGDALATSGVHRSFIMYAPSGYDPRKNIEGLIEAFARVPVNVRSDRQLVITSKFSVHEQERLRSTARKAGLAADDLVLTGFVRDVELVALYRATDLFVYPSLHEGFGLPALEAMACGAPVIGSDRTSIPEIIGSEEALFDPTSIGAIADKIAEALSDHEWLAARRAHGVDRAASFSWEQTAGRALDAIELAFAQTGAAQPPSPSSASPVTRPRLALVTPLPPQRTGIAAHVAELLPALAETFEVTLICDQPSVALAGPAARLACHDPQWFRKHAGDFDHVVYQVGNSEFHTFMLPLMRAVPGVVVLHDFFLGGLFWTAQRAGVPNAWRDALQESHGDVETRINDEVELLRRFPVNRAVLNGAHGVVVHSEHARQLVEHWYGPASDLDIHVVPLARAPRPNPDRAAARDALGIPQDVILTCCFGQVDSSKRNAEVLRAWLDSASTSDPRHQLHMVGHSPSPTFAKDLQATADRHSRGRRVTLTGWASEELYAQYLAAADLAIQLRGGSRGETSAAVLDCLNHGVATIVNAHGSAAELPETVVRRVPDDFTVTEVVQALDELLGDPDARRALGAAARAFIADQYSPESSALDYARVLRRTAPRSWRHQSDLLSKIHCAVTDEERLRPDVAESVARSLRLPVTPRQVLVDVTHAPHGLTQAQADDLVLNAPPHVRVRYVRVDQTPRGFRLLNADGYPRNAEPRHLTDLHSGDVLVVSRPENLQNPGIRGALLTAEAAGVQLTVVAGDVVDAVQRLIGR